MSLFRKPTKKIQRRVFGCDDDEEDGDPEPPPPPIISKEKKEPLREKKSSTLLSFVDEEEEGEVFKVKKSTHSKRWARQKEKVKRKPTDFDSNNFYEDEPVDNFAVQEEPKPKPKPKKKVNLEGLILSGREAAAAIGCLADEDASEEEDEQGFPRFRPESVRAALAAASGNIPDAALIHAARKTRQQARELGGAEYIPIRNENKTGPGSRLIRDDGSGDEDDDEERIHVRGIDMPSDKPNREDVEAASDAEVDSEAEQWEEQQMQKAVPAITDIGMENGIHLNLFAVAPLPPRFPPAHLMPIPGRSAPDNVTALHVALSDRIKELRVAHSEMEEQGRELTARLQNARATLAEKQARAAPLDVAYRDAQTIRGYLTDLVECLDEKMPTLVALEKRALALHRRRCEFIQERRRADVRDQAQDLLYLAARPGSTRHPEAEDKIRRAAEREGRRRARRILRESKGAAGGHRDGDSSDDQLPPHEDQHLQAERDAIRSESTSLFADALPAWRSVRGVCRRLTSCRMSQAAYLPDCLPGLLSPYIRHELVVWNPLADDDNEDYERMDWYKSTMMYGLKVEKDLSDSEDEMNGDSDVSLLATLSEDGVADDPDLMLVPTLVQKIVLPKLTELIEVAWDPMSVRSCVKLSALLQRFAALPPRASPQLRALQDAVRARLHATLSADTFLPALPPQLSDGPGGVFWRRCLGAGARLLRAALALYAPPLLCTDAAILSLIGTLCTAAGAAPPHLAAVAATTIVGIIPPCSLRPPTVRRAARLAARADMSLLAGKLKEQVESLLAEVEALGPETE